MAIRYAVASGNWSNTATWNGGTLPASTDDVYANNFAVSIDQSVTVNSLKKISNASPAITAGGSFTVTAAATVTITAGIAAADNVTNSTALLTVAAGSSAVTINASVTGGAGTGRVAVLVASAYTGVLTFNGTVTGGGASGAYGLSITAATTVSITGAVAGAGGTVGVAITGAATVTINGNCTGGGSATAWGVWVSDALAVLTVNGTVIGGSNSAGYGVNQAGSTSLVTINGAVAGGSSGPGLNQTGGAASLRGDILPSSAGVLAAVVVNARISGDIYMGGTAPSTGPNGFWPISGIWSVIDGEEIEIHTFKDGGYPSGIAGGTVILTRYGASNPAPDDVRSGVTYGAGGTVTGTLAVPPPASVAAGVPTDNTVGTAAVKLSDIAAVTGAQIAAATSG